MKNPRARPPKDPRSLLNMPSLEPTPSSHRKVPAGVPLGGLGIGIKLPGESFEKHMEIPQPKKSCTLFYLSGNVTHFCVLGLGAGFPVLKKTEREVSYVNNV